MLSIKALSSLLLLSSVVTALPGPTPGDDHHHDVCKSCNPLSGQNECDITTSCINTGNEFHCACRAGYKVDDADNDDVKKQFRLPFKDYEFLVFTAPGETCNTLCDDWTLPPPDLCKEVKLQKKCDV